MLLKCCTQYASQFGKLSSGQRTGKGQFAFQYQRKVMPNNVQTIAQLHSSHTLVKYCSKFSKPGFNSIWTMNYQMFKLDLEKTEEPEIKLPTSTGSSKKQDSSRKTTTSDLLTMPKPLTVWILRNCGKFLKRCEYQTTLLVSWETCIQVKKQQLEPDMEQQPWPTPFPIWSQSVVPCPVLTVASWPAYRFLKRQVRWLVFPSLSEFPTVHQSLGE